MLPVIIINGPLGSGKTTLIHALLKKHIEAKRTLWLKTEFGDESIDEYVLKDTGVQTKSLTGGCICHVLLSELDGVLTQIEAINDIDQVIIETSGMSHPAPVTQTIERHPHFHVAQTALIVDTTHAHDDTYPRPMILPVGTSAPYDVILFNKYNPVLSVQEESELEKTLDPWFAGVYSFINKIQIPNLSNEHKELFDQRIKQWSDQLETDMEKALQASPNDVSDNIEIEVDEETEDHEGDMDVLTFRIPGTEVTDREKIEAFAKKAPKNVIRIKGIFYTERNQWEFFNWVRGTGTWSTLPSTPAGQLLLVMGHDLKEESGLVF